MKWLWTGVREKGMSVTWYTHGTVPSGKYVWSCHDRLQTVNSTYCTPNSDYFTPKLPCHYG